MLPRGVGKCARRAVRGWLHSNPEQEELRAGHLAGGNLCGGRSPSYITTSLVQLFYLLCLKYRAFG